MKLNSQKRGSALLIVLGMIAFMIVSAVAFSAYMRTTRLPSSYLRRVVSSRMLVKAALAEAIDEIDAAVGNFPHPNVWHKNGANMLNHSDNQVLQTGSRPCDQLTRGANANAWLGRVYIGCEDTGVNRVEDCLIAQNATVSTLSLEGLAYIPPPLVNEARYYSRHSLAGRWHTMGFDTGRYAFCAIDVSDYFDINALTAGSPRNSSPSGRISLSYLFENGDHTAASGVGDSWDTFVEQILNSKVPFVSMADWNLAVGSRQFGDIKSYFCRYINNNETSFYGGDGASDADKDKIRRMTFVTDGWFPSDATGTGTAAKYDLADEAKQPFQQVQLQSTARRNYYEVTEESREGARRLLEYMPNVSLAMLYDYLDKDHIPLSLSIPTTERVPMIAGFDLELQGSQLGVKATPSQPVSVPDKTPQVGTVKTTVTETYNLNGDTLFQGIPAVKAIVTYPFRHKDGISETFTVDGGLAIFLTSEDMGLRPGAAIEWLKFTDKDRFKDVVIKDGVMLLKFAPRNVSFNNDVNNESDAVKELDFVVDTGSIVSQLADDSAVLLKATWECQQTAQQDPNTGTYNWTAPTPADDQIKDQGTVKEAFCKLPPLKANGSVDTRFTQGGDALVNFLKNGVAVKLNIAVYLRMTDSNGNTVDLVPACGENDILNGSNNWSMPESQIVLQDNFGNASPLMRFNTAASFTFSLDGLTQAASTPSAITIDPKAVMVCDPRYNYAPESWFRFDGAMTKDVWLQNNHAKDTTRDGDIFMQVSDQCYLQSIYELANLPRLGNDGFGNFGDKELGNLKRPSNFNDTTFKTVGSELNHDFMWRTYDPFDRYKTDDGGGDGFRKLQFVSSGNGFKVNPYSDSTNVVLAALANTPHDWRCASSNNLEIMSDQLNAAQFNADYAWNQYSSGAKMEWGALEELAVNFIDDMKDASGSADAYEDVWETVWRDLGWYQSGQSNPSEFLTEDIPIGSGSKLYNTDKKFLYGYWHDCFASKQQLFLIFVRAEPLLMGGGALHQSPPQLGARAVALVWRDPKNRSTIQYAPHRTRVLFYRQLD